MVRMWRVNNKFNVDNNPSGFENEHLNQTDYHAGNIAKFEIAKVTSYDVNSNKGYVNFNNTQTEFINITSIRLSPKDTVVLGYANNSKSLICLGVYEYDDYQTLVKYRPEFTATGGLAFDTSVDALYPTHNSWYTKVDNIVSFCIEIDFTTVTNFGTGQYKVELPFAPLADMYFHFNGWLWVDINDDPDVTSHTILVADHKNKGSKILDLHWLYATTAIPKPIQEQVFKYGNPAVLTSSSRAYITGTYLTGEL